MTVFHILSEFCRTHAQNCLSYLKLCLSGKHSDFKQMFPTPTAKFQQSQCHKLNLAFPNCLSVLWQLFVFGGGGLLPHTAALCWPLSSLPTFFILCSFILPAHPCCWCSTGLPSLTAPVWTHAFGIYFHFVWHIHLLSGLQLLPVLQSWPQSSCMTLHYVETPTGGHVPWVLSWDSVHMALFLFHGPLHTC